MKETKKYKYGKWYNVEVCVFCKTELSDHELYYSMGRCPHCGKKHPDAGTIVESIEFARRTVTELKYPWWIGWLLNPVTYEEK